MRVQAHFPAGVRALAESDAAWCEHRHGFDVMGLLPDPPTEWGSSSLSSFVMPRPRDLHRALVPSRKHPFEVAEDDTGTVVTWFVGDLRPRSTEVGLDDTFAVVTDEHRDEVVVDWRVTAKGVDHVFAGKSALRCAQQDGTRLEWTSRHR